MRKFILILSALMVSSLAYAADPVKAPRRAAVPDNNWTGFFFGLAGGYGFNGETSYGLGINHDVKGWFGCVEGGVRAQALNNPIVLGVVLDACYGDIDGNTSPIPGANVAGKIDWFGSARGLVGVSLNSPILLYGTFGVGAARAETAVSFGPIGLNDKSTPIGWTGGLGLEYMMAKSTSLNIEWQRYHFSDEAACFGGTPCIGGSYKHEMDLVKVGYRKGF